MMTPEETKHFFDTVAATAYALKAKETVELAGLEVTRENLALALGQWMNPESPHFDEMVLMVDAHVREIIRTADHLRTLRDKNKAH